MMAALATREHPTAEQSHPAQASSAASSRLFEPGGVTLEDVVLGVWADLVADGRAECPVCGGSISADGGCPGCGSELS
jgi:hypothetical protein